MLRQGIFTLALRRRRPPGARSVHSDRKIMQKIVTNHSTNCSGLVDVLKKFVGQNYDSVIRCNPARISRARGSSENFDLRVNSQIGDTGSFKCIARSGTIVQDVYYGKSDFAHLEDSVCGRLGKPDQSMLAQACKENETSKGSRAQQCSMYSVER